MNRRNLFLPKGIDKETSKRYQNIMYNMKPQKNISYVNKKNDSEIITIMDVITVYKAKVIDGVEQKLSEEDKKKRSLKLLSKLFKRFQDDNTDYKKIY